MCIVCQYQTVSGQVCVLPVSIRQSGQLCVLSVSMKKVFVMPASIRQVCVLSVSIRQLLDRHVYCLSVSDSFWTTGMCLVC